MQRLSTLLPRQLLVLDASGAALTAFSTAVLIPWVFGSLGLPAWFFPAFGVAATGLCLFSTLSAFGTRHRASLRLVALGNVGYLVASAAVTAAWWPTVSPLWLGYLSFEAVVMLVLVRVEWRASGETGA